MKLGMSISAKFAAEGCAPKIFAPGEWIKVRKAIQHFDAVVYRGLVILLQGLCSRSNAGYSEKLLATDTKLLVHLQLHLDCLLSVKLERWPELPV